MDLHGKLLQIFIAVVSFALIIGLIPIAHALDVPGQVNIIANTCGLAVISGSPINYGDVAGGDVSMFKLLEVDNTGNTNADLYVRGTDWTAASSPGPVMNVGATHWTLSPGALSEATQLTTSDVLATTAFHNSILITLTFIGYCRQI